MDEPIKVLGFDYTFENSTWVFKAEEQKPFRQDGTLKKKYKELPQFNLIYDIDAHMQGQMDNEIKTAVKDVLKILKP